jgi:hypothetical protein
VVGLRGDKAITKAEVATTPTGLAPPSAGVASSVRARLDEFDGGKQRAEGLVVAWSETRVHLANGDEVHQGLVAVGEELGEALNGSCVALQVIDQE